MRRYVDSLLGANQQVSWSKWKIPKWFEIQQVEISTQVPRSRVSPTIPCIKLCPPAVIRISSHNNINPAPRG